MSSASKPPEPGISRRLNAPRSGNDIVETGAAIAGRDALIRTVQQAREPPRVAASGKAPPAAVGLSRRPSPAASSLRVGTVTHQKPVTGGSVGPVGAARLSQVPNAPPPSARAPNLSSRPGRSNLPIENPFAGVARAFESPTLSASRSNRPPSTSAKASYPSSSGREVRLKGINFTTALEAVQQLYGATARSRVERETTGALGDALRFGGIVVGGWYPIAWYRELWQVLRSNLGVDEAAARRIGHRAAGIGVNVAYRALARMTSPAMLLSMSSRAFRYYFEPGSLAVKQPEPNRLTAEWQNCDGFTSYIWSEVEGGATYFIEATGVKGVTFSVIAGGGNANFMLATATWR